MGKLGDFAGHFKDRIQKRFAKKGTLSARFEARLNYWWDAFAPSEVRAVGMLLNKPTMRRYIKSLGVNLPQLYLDVSSVAEIDFAALPPAVVIKPGNGSNSDGVMLIKGETEHLRGVSIQRSKLREFCQQVIESTPRSANRVLVEEFLQDFDSRFTIPRDFKVYVAGGRARIIQVIDRNGPKELRNHSFYTREWIKIGDLFQTAYRPGPAVAKPPFHTELLKLADLIAGDINVFMRLDFYITTRGVVFGEFTFDPFSGTGFTPYGEKYLLDIMDTFPDAIPTAWSYDGRQRLTQAARLPS